MGFFKKIGKGIAKKFKKIGKGIKSAFKSFGKFMGKFGVLGQVAMFFIMPHIAGALMKGMGALYSGIAGTAATAGTTAGIAGATATTAATAGTGLAGATGSGIIASASRAVGSLMNGAAGYVSKAVNAFSNVTEGVTNFIGEFSKTAANKISSTLGFQKVPFANASSNFFGAGDSAWSRSTDMFKTRMSNLTASKDVIKAFDATATEIRIGTPTASQLKTGATMGLTPEQVSSGLGPDISDADYFNIEPTTSQIETGATMGFSPEELKAGLSSPDILDGDYYNYTAQAEPQSLLGKSTEYMSNAWDATKAQGVEEFQNLGPNVIKRTADVVTDFVPSAVSNAGNEMLFGTDPVDPDRMGQVAQLENFGSFEAETTQQVVPTANYNANMGAMPYGFGAVEAGRFAFGTTV